MKERFELELISGNKAAVFIDPDKVYSLRELSYYEWHFTKKFPFIKRKEIRYAYFRVQDTFTTMRDSNDSCFKVKCTMSEICDILGIPLRRFTSGKLRSAIMSG